MTGFMRVPAAQYLSELQRLATAWPESCLSHSAPVSPPPRPRCSPTGRSDAYAPARPLPATVETDR